MRGLEFITGQLTAEPWVSLACRSSFKASVREPTCTAKRPRDKVGYKLKFKVSETHGTHCIVV